MLSVGGTHPPSAPRVMSKRLCQSITEHPRAKRESKQRIAHFSVSSEMEHDGSDATETACAIISVSCKKQNVVLEMIPKPVDIPAKHRHSLVPSDATWLAGTRVPIGQDPKTCRHCHGSPPPLPIAQPLPRLHSLAAMRPRFLRIRKQTSDAPMLPKRRCQHDSTVLASASQRFF